MNTEDISDGEQTDNENEYVMDDGDNLPQTGNEDDEDDEDEENYTQQQIQDLLADIQNLYEHCHVGNPKHMNFLVLGLPANGKSAFINTISSSFHGKIIRWAPEGASSSAQKTLLYGVYNKIVHYGTVETQPILLFDTKGMHDDDHSDIIRACVTEMDGVTYTWRFWDTERANTNWFAVKERKIHGIIFVNKVGKRIPTNLAASVKAVADEKGIPLGVAITHCDKVNPTKQLKNRELRKYQQFFNTEIVCFIDNYTRKDTKTDLITTGRVLTFISSLQQQCISSMEQEQQLWWGAKLYKFFFP